MIKKPFHNIIQSAECKSQYIGSSGSLRFSIFQRRDGTWLGTTAMRTSNPPGKLRRIEAATLEEMSMKLETYSD